MNIFECTAVLERVYNLLTLLSIFVIFTKNAENYSAKKNFGEEKSWKINPGLRIKAFL